MMVENGDGKLFGSVGRRIYVITTGSTAVLIGVPTAGQVPL
jgi:hypothetical protein